MTVRLRYGPMALWHDGAVALWRDSMMALWHCGIDGKLRFDLEIELLTPALLE